MNSLKIGAFAVVTVVAVLALGLVIAAGQGSQGRRGAISRRWIAWLGISWWGSA